MAQIIVATGKVVSYDGNLLYGRDEAYTVKDTYENEVKANKDASANLISIVEQFTATTITDVTEVNLVTGDTVGIASFPSNTIAGMSSLPAGTNSIGSVSINGSTMELYGATIANRPAANTVTVGAYYKAVQTGQIWQSDGTNWVVQ